MSSSLEAALRDLKTKVHISRVLTTNDKDSVHNRGQQLQARGAHEGAFENNEHDIPSVCSYMPIGHSDAWKTWKRC